MICEYDRCLFVCLYLEPSLWPLSDNYKFVEPQKLSWKTCQLSACPGSDRPKRIHYAEITSITVQLTHKTNNRVHFNEVLHSLKFAIKVQAS